MTQWDELIYDFIYMCEGDKDTGNHRKYKHKKKNGLKFKQGLKRHMYLKPCYYSYVNTRCLL